MGSNQRKTIEMTHDEIVEYLEQSRTAIMITNGPSGHPHAVAMWYGLVDGAIWFETKAKSQKAVNLRRDPRITVLLHGDNPWDWAEVRGRVVDTIGEPRAREHIDELSQKYMGQPYGNPIGPQGRIILVVAADKVNTAGG